MPATFRRILTCLFCDSLQLQRLFFVSWVSHNLTNLKRNLYFELSFLLKVLLSISVVADVAAANDSFALIPTAIEYAANVSLTIRIRTQYSTNTWQFCHSKVVIICYTCIVIRCSRLSDKLPTANTKLRCKTGAWHSQKGPHYDTLPVSLVSRMIQIIVQYPVLHAQGTDSNNTSISQGSSWKLQSNEGASARFWLYFDHA